MFSSVNTCWTLVGAFLVYFMQAGFALCEAGFTRAKNTGNILMKNMMDFCIGTPCYWIIGFGLMFGGTGALIGGFDPFIQGDYSHLGLDIPLWVYIVFQTVFCATTATIASGSYRKEIERLAPKTEVFEQACPLFVPLVENAFVSPDDPIPRLTAERYLTPIREAGVDTLILGCTHYPIISETIRRVMGENVTLISSGREAAKSCRTVLEENGLLCDGKTDGTQQYFVSDDTESFYKVAELFLGQSVESCVECIDIERY